MLLMCVFLYSMKQRKSSEVTSTVTVTVTVIVTEDSGTHNFLVFSHCNADGLCLGFDLSTFSDCTVGPNCLILTGM
jgi:hypothetical protein